MLKLPDTEKSCWQEIYPKSRYPALRKDLQLDVAVIGAGITGLSTAYFLKQSGFTVAVLDKATVGGGTTGRTTGKVTAQHNIMYHDLQRRAGSEAARLYGQANQAAVARIAAIIKKERIDCDWQIDDNYVFTTDPRRVARFKQEAITASQLGLPASLETSIPLPFEIQAAVKFANQGKLHAQKYLLGLAGAIHGNGSYVFERSNVVMIRDGKPARARTKQAEITARHIVVATNVPTLPLLARGSYCLMEYPMESYIVAGEPGQALRGMYISPDRHNYSVLPLKVNGRQLLLVGGEGHISGLRASKKARYQRLAAYAEQHFGVTAITHHWSDRDYLAYDNVPLVGPLYPWSKHLYIGTAFKKWGLSNGTVAGMILHDLISGRPNTWAATFSSRRLKPVASIPRVAAEHLGLGRN